jgi:hypothetical protein
MTPEALDIAQQMQTMSDSEIEYLWDVLKKRHDDSLLALVDMKLADSMNTKNLSGAETDIRWAKLGIAQREA